MTWTLRSLALALLACRPAGLPPGPATLEGLELPLAAGPTLRLAVDGRVGQVAAAVELEPGQPLGLITPGCGLDAPLQTPTRVANPFGGVDALALVHVDALSLGGVPVGPFEAGLVEGRGCRIVLGEAVLDRLALEVRLAARTVRLARTRPLADSLAALPPGEEAVVVPLAREPRYDWPLVTVRAVQGAAHLEVPLLLVMGQSWTRLYEGPVRAAGLLPREELLRGSPAPAGRRFEGLALDALLLAPGAELRDVAVELEPGDAPRLPQGVLAADAWGRFDVRLDLSEGVLLLHRPRLEAPGRCGEGTQASAEACREVGSRGGDAGRWVGECRPVRCGEKEAAARRLLELARRLRPDAGRPVEVEPADPR